MVALFSAEILPEGFRYPPTFAQLAGKEVDGDMFPWLLEDAGHESSQQALELGLQHDPPLVPFAFLDLGDGDLACFVANGNDEPAVQMLIVDGSTRAYGYASFEHWYSSVLDDMAKWQQGVPMNVR